MDLPVAKREIVADGSVQPLEFDYKLTQSSWVALRVFPSCHTNPIFVEVDGKPIRASKKSAQWCLDAVETCWKRKEPQIRPGEKAAAAAAYDVARKIVLASPAASVRRHQVAITVRYVSNPYVRYVPSTVRVCQHRMTQGSRQQTSGVADRCRTAPRIRDAECALRHETAFQLLIATILSAQCTDVRVNLVTPELFARYPTAADMANASTSGTRKTDPEHWLLSQQGQEHPGLLPEAGRGTRRRVAAGLGAVGQVARGRSQDGQCRAWNGVWDRQRRGGRYACAANFPAIWSNEAASPRRRSSRN